MITNFLGLPIHESDDELIRWNDTVKEVLKIREAWDKIPKDLLPYVKVLLEKAHDNAHCEEAEQAAGEGF